METIEKIEAELKTLQVEFAETTEQAEILNAQMQQMGSQLQQVQSVRAAQLKAIQEKKVDIQKAKTTTEADAAE